jgi:SNF2 family DNA or RNA helicase
MTVMQFVRAEEWRPPPPAVVFGDLHADGRRIILIPQGDGWDMRTVGERLSAMTARKTVEDKAAGIISVPATWMNVTQLSHSFPGTHGTPRWAPGPRLCQWIVEELTRRTTLPDRAAYPELPPGLEARPYQDAAAAAVAQLGRFLVFDEPGTGKTLSTLLGLEWRRRLGHAISPLVIITPAWAVCDVWAREIARWLPGWKAPVMYGGPGRPDLLGTADVYLTTYSTARIDANDASGPLCRLNPAAIVGDEAHLAKGSRLVTEKGNSTVSAAFRRIASHAGTVIGLTGTPVTLNTEDVFTILAATDPGSFSSRKTFRKRYCETQDDPNGYEEKVTGLKVLAAGEFFAGMTGAMRRVTKKQVMPWLPDKIYSVRRVKMPPEWRTAYDGLRDDMLADLPDGGELNVMDVIAQYTFLGQLACAAADVEITEGPEEDPYTGLLKKHYHAVLKRPSWKCDAMLEILAERPGQPVVVFAPSRQLAMIAGEMAAEAGRRVGYIVGLGGGVTAKTRQADIAAFAAGKLDLIAATTGAGGTGIDGLQVAGTAVFLQRPRSLGASIQGEDRLHRIGSEIHTRGVEIIDIIAEDTVDETIREQIVAKGGMAAQFFRDPSFVRSLLGGLRLPLMMM